MADEGRRTIYIRYYVKKIKEAKAYLKKAKDFPKEAKSYLKKAKDCLIRAKEINDKLELKEDEKFDKAFDVLDKEDALEKAPGALDKLQDYVITDKDEKNLL